MALSSHDWAIVAAGVVQALHLAVTWKTRHKTPEPWFIEAPAPPVSEDAPPPAIASTAKQEEPAPHAAAPVRPAHPDHSHFSKNGKRKTINL